VLLPYFLALFSASGLLAQSTITALADPGNLVNYRGEIGQTYLFQVVGSTQGSVWGTDIYTDDSALATAAVHAGVLREGQIGVVRVTIMAGQGSYAGSTRNGVSSVNYGDWIGSYRIEGLSKANQSLLPDSAFPDPGNLMEYRGQTGQTFLFQVTGSSQGSVWGTDVYTDDSALATAAVHAGILETSETGLVAVTIISGQASYTGTTRNGITTSQYGSWYGSYSVAAP
jgi:hypothetical protein